LTHLDACNFNVLFSSGATLFSQISTRHLSKDGKLFYVSEPAKKLDHVTSKEECISHSGSLLHADALTTGTKFQDIENFNLSANTSYWLEGRSVIGLFCK
jgi:hypothetical protein